MKDITRRDFIKLGGVGAVAILGVNKLKGLASAMETSRTELGLPVERSTFINYSNFNREGVMGPDLRDVYEDKNSKLSYFEPVNQYYYNEVLVNDPGVDTIKGTLLVRSVSTFAQRDSETAVIELEDSSFSVLRKDGDSTCSMLFSEDIDQSQIIKCFPLKNGMIQVDYSDDTTELLSCEDSTIVKVEGSRVLRSMRDLNNHQEDSSGVYNVRYQAELDSRYNYRITNDFQVENLSVDGSLSILKGINNVIEVTDRHDSFPGINGIHYIFLDDMTGYFVDGEFILKKNDGNIITAIKLSNIGVVNDISETVVSGLSSKIDRISLTPTTNKKMLPEGIEGGLTFHYRTSNGDIVATPWLEVCRDFKNDVNVRELDVSPELQSMILELNTVST